VDVLVVRHAVALDKDEANERGMPDAERPLTKEGRRRMKRVARGLARSVPSLSAIFSSPWRRAVETAELLQARFKGVRILETGALLPDAEPEALARYVTDCVTECLEERLVGSPARAVVAVVGHEPHLSEWVSWCLAGPRSSGGAPGPILELRPSIELRKGGACSLRFAGPAGPGLGQLRWLMTPAVLRQL
jgi:phosphohistidine phosphatase